MTDSPLEKWDIHFPNSEPWPLDTDDQLHDLRIRIAYAVAKSADADGNMSLYLATDEIGKLMWSLGIPRFQYLDLIYTDIDFDDPRKMERIRVRDEVTDALAQLVMDGWLEWVTVDGHPALHISDLKAARRFLVDNAEQYGNVGYQDDERLSDEQIEELNTMPYRRYLKTDVWKRRREKHLKFARNRCQVCNADGPELNVHHRTYERRGYESAADLIVLCKECHSLFHEHGRIK